MASFPHLGDADSRILAAICRYDYLKPEQICRLLYSPGSMSYDWLRLSFLEAQGLLLRVRLAHTAHIGGKAPSVYTLSTKGQHLLRTPSQPLLRRKRLSEEQVKARNSLFMQHTLSTNDFLIAAELLCRQHPDFALASLRSERALKRDAVSVRLSGKNRLVAVDGFLDVRIRNEEQACVCLELDRGTEDAGFWKEKVAALLAFANGPYQQAFGTEAITIAVVATPGPHRRDMLVQWTEQELSRRHERHEADLFRFLDGEPTARTPEELFLSPIWLRPFGTAALPLLE